MCYNSLKSTTKVDLQFIDIAAEMMDNLQKQRPTASYFSFTTRKNVEVFRDEKSCIKVLSSDYQIKLF